LTDSNSLSIKNNKILKNSLNEKIDQPYLKEAFQVYINHHELKERTLADYKEVSELKQLVQQLSNQQKAVTVVNTPKVPSTTIA
ncbi:hypothetical protein KIH72_019020, partial [Acinetobacter baumannii]|nr:hypothetical protein [Acinetobacter baumannii]